MSDTIVNGQKTFTRVINFDLESAEETKEVDLIIHQLLVGDEGCVIWDAALVLLKFLFTSKGKTFVKDRAVLELGAGTGVVGIASALAGASSVYITDLEKLLPLIDVNVKANHDLLKKYRPELYSGVDSQKDSADRNKVLSEVFTWGSDEDMEKYLEKLKQMHEVSLSKSVSACILIADCVYYEEGNTDLVKTIVQLLENLSDDSMVLLSYEHRTTGNKELILKKFFTLLKSHNIKGDFVSYNDMDPSFRCDDIDIVKLTM